MTQSFTARDTPGVIAPPPLILLGFVVAGLGLDWLRPAAFLPNTAQYLLGGVLIVVAGAMALSAFIRFIRAGTPIPTRQPTTALVASGPYRFTRNPIYVGMILLLLGIGVMVDSVWIVALAVPFALVLRYGVIAREERYLAAKFGDAYRLYCTKVRRWI